MVRQCMGVAVDHRVALIGFLEVVLMLSCKELETVIIVEGANKYFQVGIQLPVEDKKQLMDFLKGNLDVFGLSAYEAPGIDLEFICHHLNVNPKVNLKKQLPWHSSKEHAKTVKDEVRKLKQVGAIKEVFYPEWLVNTVVVRKKLGKWRMCVDFTDLNKACPKDPFLVPRIDQLVDAMYGHPRMSFLYAFQGYY